MPGFDGFLDLPPRTPKPRTAGLTHVIDKGLNIRDIEGLFDTAGAYVDIVKLGWGTSYVTLNLEKKIALYRSFETPVVCGGTLFEAVYARGKIDKFTVHPFFAANEMPLEFDKNIFVPESVDKKLRAIRRISGSARVSRAGDDVSSSRTFGRLL